LKVLDKQHRNKCCPNLDIERILSGTHKGLDLEVLLQGLEKQLNLPSVLIDSRYGGGTELKVVGKEDNFSLFFRIPYHHSAKHIRAVFLGIESSKANQLIGYDVSMNGNRTTCYDRIVGVLLQPGHKEYSLRAPVREKLVIIISTIHGYKRTWSERHVSGDGHIMSFPV